jgi:uncharacterized protein YijF (DUF1287 family)
MNRTIAWFSLMLIPALSTAQTPADALVVAAHERTKHFVIYKPSYVRLDYPMGDVPANTGVCTDVVIRAYRAALGIDLQVKVHEDMSAQFEAYPSERIWGLQRPDKNIDHRRVPNLRAFFERHGQSLPISQQGSDYQAGDIVTWRLSKGQPHIGIVTERVSADGKRPLIVHNIGLGPKLDDMLFDYEITGRYRYLPEASESAN